MNRKQPRQDVFPQCGIVTSVNENYRVKVFLPLLGIETDFIRVGSQYVGAGWGLWARPHVGNEVLVDFPNGDLNNGIVVCRLYSEECDPAPAEGDNLTLVHESGSVLRFDQAGNVLLEAKGVLTLNGVKVNIN
ncbi:phage baseplate assembly protein V [Sporomusa sp. KB1]|jgi:phage baseplate assembly protein V|uniref:phage baseplate assembly protein V n=1 Tax=Sporomusa sp. KB1 TaxID=943346 RepID=UPI0011AB1920|nr:phage baseplate assembly protein V [Sporomusa sp. KB1]TWH45890.1 phage baseplate assembly protein V [Sporomusa sp. KB1]